VYHKECCYTGDYVHKNLVKENDYEVLDLKKEAKNFTYEAKDMSSDLSQEKINDLVKMYDKFIDPSLRPEWLPKTQSIITANESISSTSSDLARRHRATLRKRKKGKKP